MDKGLTNTEILKLYPETTWIPYDELVSRFLAGESIIDIMKPYDCIIVLYYTISEDYGHWTCVILHRDEQGNPKSLEFFDPYGFKIDGVLKGVKKSLRKKMKQRFPTLSYMFYQSGLPVEYNEKPLQEQGDHIATCGYWTALRLQWQHIPLEMFQKIFITVKEHGRDADKIVYNINAPLLGKKQIP